MSAEVVLAQGEAAPNAAGDTKASTSAALTALCLIARLHHVAADAATLQHQLGLAPSQPLATRDLLLAA